ncbi:hypothetical protein GCM10010503_31820 [Streptomyces lucensis JCM 4490]|uniref:Uncharacterized protein n=1 Tax=Streptomyces lucensis JCM 4490 TaxID=1306176 RepID=A0A918J6G2_9ACTN|nr:hypothetical protein GCM10010503_31820 [Streptomyces lucensis JCM 4490]
MRMREWRAGPAPRLGPAPRAGPDLLARRDLRAGPDLRVGQDYRGRGPGPVPGVRVGPPVGSDPPSTFRRCSQPHPYNLRGTPLRDLRAIRRTGAHF